MALDQNLIKKLLYNNYQDKNMILIIDCFFVNNIVDYNIIFKDLKKQISIENLRKTLILMFKKNLIVQKENEKKGNVLLYINEDRIRQLLHKFNILDYYISSQQQMEALLINYLIQNYCSKPKQMLNELNLYLTLEHSNEDYSQQLEQKLKLLKDQKIIFEEKLENDFFLKLNMQKIYNLLRIQTIKEYIKNEIDENSSLVVEGLLQQSQLFTKAEYAKTTENIEINKIKFYLMQNNQRFYNNCHIDDIFKNFQMNYSNYFYVDEVKIQLKLKNIINQMKLSIMENHLEQKSIEHLRVFKGIVVGQTVMKNMSESLLIPEPKLKKILFDLEAKNLIIRKELENGQIVFYENFTFYMQTMEQFYLKICLNLFVRKIKLEKEQKNDIEKFFLKETQLSNAIKDISKIILIIHDF